MEHTAIIMSQVTLKHITIYIRYTWDHFTNKDSIFTNEDKKLLTERLDLQPSRFKKCGYARNDSDSLNDSCIYRPVSVPFLYPCNTRPRVIITISRQNFHATLITGIIVFWLRGKLTPTRDLKKSMKKSNMIIKLVSRLPLIGALVRQLIMDELFVFT